MPVYQTPIFGSLLNQNNLVHLKNPVISIPGQFQKQTAQLDISYDILSKHIMLVGGTGCGKSNVFYHMVSQIKKKMTNDDVMIVFDSKGDFFDAFGEKKDIVIGNSDKYSKTSEKWNIYREVLSDGWDQNHIETNAQEMAWAIFRNEIEKSKDPFFPNAARDLFNAILLCILSYGVKDQTYRQKYFYNSELKKALGQSTVTDIIELIESNPQTTSVKSYLGDGTSGQALGVYAEMIGCIRKLLVGVFSEKGSFSIRNFVRQKGAKTLFIEYDLAIGNTLFPLYSLMFDLAIKEALGRGKSDGNVYLICDEFKLLPYLQHIEDAVNFGRSLGLKVIAGIQSISQLSETYGEYRGNNILSGFSTTMAFRANDSITRKYITDLHGENLIQEQSLMLNKSMQSEIKSAHVVEDWDLNKLQVGEAVVGFPFENPFVFQFDLFK